MSLRTSPQTGVALSKDSLRSQSVSPWLPQRGSWRRSRLRGQIEIFLPLRDRPSSVSRLRETREPPSPWGKALEMRIVTGGNPWKGPHHCEHWFAMTTSITVPARLLTNLSNFVFNSVIGCSKPPSILKTRKVAEAVSRLLSNSVESSFLPLFFPNPKRKPPMGEPSGVFPHLLPNCVVPP